MLQLLATVNGGGVSINKGTLEVIALLLVIILLVFLILGHGRWWRRP